MSGHISKKRERDLKTMYLLPCRVEALFITVWLIPWRVMSVTIKSIRQASLENDCLWKLSHVKLLTGMVRL